VLSERYQYGLNLNRQQCPLVAIYHVEKFKKSLRKLTESLRNVVEFYRPAKSI
jgi:hypothetical protein